MPNLLQIIVYLVQKIKWQNELIQKLSEYITWLEDESDRPTKGTDMTKLDFNKLLIDEPPIVEEVERLDFKQLLTEAAQNGKPIEKVRRRRSSTSIDASIRCAKCNAPHDYLYKNNGDNGQYKCKICSTLFHKKNRYSKDIVLKCRHCEKTIYKIKSRKDFDIYKCQNDNCPYYQYHLEQLTPKQRTHFENHPEAFKLRYLYRAFHLNLDELKAYGQIDAPVDLARIHASPRLLGEILTYHVNYGLPASKTAALLYDIHGVRITGQTVLNYTAAVGAQLYEFTQHYPYELSSDFCGDETYIRVNGKWQYICYFFDATKKIILSQRLSAKRDTALAIQAIHDVLDHFKATGVPEDLNLIVDGNPIYKLAQHFLAQHDFSFDITQVIGLTNEDEVSKEYRPLKQIIERLNRTYKGHYRGSHGFKSQNGARAHIACFTACFNFLRPHQSLEGEVPVKIPYMHETCETMPDKWIFLLNLGHQLLHNQVA
uniref:transposase n=2 Tax=Aerococcus urinaeequi TaxID=51665 RepID=UPI00352B2278